MSYMWHYILDAVRVQTPEPCGFPAIGTSQTVEDESSSME
jgi:hypothetical protein